MGTIAGHVGQNKMVEKRLTTTHTTHIERTFVLRHYAHCALLRILHITSIRARALPPDMGMCVVVRSA